MLLTLLVGFTSCEDDETIFDHIASSRFSKYSGLKYSFAVSIFPPPLSCMLFFYNRFHTEDTFEISRLCGKQSLFQDDVIHRLDRDH